MAKVYRLAFTLGAVLLIGGCGEDSPAGPETPTPPDPPDPPVPTIPRYDFRPTLAVGPRGGCQILETSDRCWGVNSVGGFGNGMQSTDWSYPVDPGWTQDFVLLTMGNDFTCGMTADGEGYCWGFNRYGLGVDAPLGVVPTPTRLPASEPWSYLEALAHNACGVTESGGGFCWGRNRSGEIGDSTVEDRNVPTPVAGDHTWYMISSGAGHTCGVDTDKGLWCWGSNDAGQLGIGTEGEDVLAPTPVDTVRSWASVSAGQGRTCAITDDFQGWCWGAGDLGNGNTAGSASPVLVSGDHRWARLRTIWGTCGITTTEEAFCWGPADDGQIGSGLVYGGGAEELAPLKVTGNLSWASLTAPTLFAVCGETTGADVLCWGKQTSTVCSRPAWSPEPVLSSPEERAECELRFVPEPPFQFRRAVRDSTFAGSILAMGGGGSYVWELIDGTLPEGLSFAGDGDRGRIEGTPLEAGYFDFRVRVSAGGEAVEADGTFLVELCQYLERPSPEPPAAKVGDAYSFGFETTGADGIYEWRLQSGNLPPGLELATDGLLSGTPTTEGTFNFEILVEAPNCGATREGIRVELTVES